MNVFRLPDPREAAFIGEWLRNSGFGAPPDTYWDPRKGAWVKYSTSSHPISDVGIAPPDVQFKTPDETFERVEQSWATIKAQHPNAIFDPRLRAWRVPSAPATTPGSSPAADDLTKRTELAKKELDELDRQRRLNILNPEEWERRRQEVRRKYGLE
jgi:hypothetical protein